MTQRSQTPEYRTWSAMVRRCYDPSFAAYPWYGARGITVCERWRNSFEAFVEDMGPRPQGSTIERKDRDQPYGPHNCVWADPKQQARNRSNNRLMTHEGETLTLAEWAERSGLPYDTLKYRLNSGLPSHEVLAPENRKPLMLTKDGETLPLMEWAKRLGVKPITLHMRVRRVGAERALVPGKGRPGPRPETFTKDGETLTLKEWAERLGVDRAVLRSRLQRMGPEAALVPGDLRRPTTPKDGEDTATR